MSTTYRKKLIEVALPLEAINVASAREKSIRHGHPSTLHLWWARRPLAAARAVLFSQLVDDPSSWTDLFPTEEAQNHERQRLFRLIEDLVLWENSNNETVINAARLEIARSHARSSSSPKANKILAEGVTPDVVNEYLATELPPVHDPFAGGGTIPLEAQRLGLRAIATDLNPVAVMINKALIEIPPKFSGKPPVNPDSRSKDKLRPWKGAEGLAEDVRYYGAWMREEAKKRIGHLYPEVDLPKEHGGGRAKVIAWIWARTVRCPNPGCGFDAILTKSLRLSGKGDTAVPSVDRQAKQIRFDVRQSEAGDGAGTVDRRGARCIACGTTIPLDYVRSEARAGRMGAQLVAQIAEGPRRRVYVAPTPEAIRSADCRGETCWEPNAELPAEALGFRVQRYGMTRYVDLFSRRQLVSLTCFSNLCSEVMVRANADGASDDYARALAVYLAFAVDKAANYWSTLCSWYVNKEIMVSTFGLPTLSMVWDYAEANPFSDSSGNWSLGVTQAAGALEGLSHRSAIAEVRQSDVVSAFSSPAHAIVQCDPPYYDNIGYANLSDFFYVWMRHSLRDVGGEAFRTMLTPKADELIAEPGRFDGDKSKAVRHFEDGLGRAFEVIRRHAEPSIPTAIFYAFKQQESDAEAEAGAEAVVSSGWEKMLTALLSAGFQIDGTLPIRTEQPGGLREAKRNALASSIVLVCRSRGDDAPTSTRGEFRRLLRKELPDALKKLQQGNIAPVDVAQASIGPGMEIFSRHKQVLEADGSPMTVRSALQLINEVLDEYLASGEGDFDADTRFAITWYEQHGWEPGPYGDAETLAKARNVSVGGVVEAGICQSAAGKVRILKRSEMRPLDYDPAADERPTVWEFTQHMIRNLEDDGEEAAARLLKKLGSAADATRELAYRLYNTCERKKWAEDARSYNALILAWTELEKLAARMGDDPPPAAPSKPAKGGVNGKKKAKAAKAPKKGQQALFEGDD